MFPGEGFTIGAVVVEGDDGDVVEGDGDPVVEDPRMVHVQGVWYSSVGAESKSGVVSSWGSRFLRYIKMM